METTHLLLCLCMSQVWCQSNNAPAPQMSSSTTTTTPAPATEQPPPNVENVSVNRTETQLTLQWKEVSSSSMYSYNYTLTYSNGTLIADITGTGDGHVKHTVSGLSPGTQYDFILYTVFKSVNSTGYLFSEDTRPRNVENVSVHRTETQLTLQWKQVSGSSLYNYTLTYSNGSVIAAISGTGTGHVSHTVSDLSPGTQYDFVLYTLFKSVDSTGYPFSEVTRPRNVENVSVNRAETQLTLQWKQVSSSSSYSYNYTLTYSNGTVIADITGKGAGHVKHTVSDLSPGTQYDFVLYTVFKGVDSTGHIFSEVTRPRNVENVSVHRTETQLTLQWKEVSGSSLYNYTLRYSNGTVIADITGTGDGHVKHTVSGLSPGTQYDFILYTVFKSVNSTGYLFSEDTRPRNVENVSVHRTETQLILQWKEVSGSSLYNYTLRYSNGSVIADITGTGDGHVKHTVSGLSPGTQYDFVLYTMFKSVNSTGYIFSEVTRPRNVENVSVHRTETQLTLQWKQVSGSSLYNYTLTYSNGSVIADITGTGDGHVKHTVSDLSPGTQYDFVLYTMFKSVNSTGYIFSEVTRPLNVEDVSVIKRNETHLTLQWERASNDPSYRYTLKYSSGTEIIGTGAGSTEYTISGLSPGTKYEFVLFTVFRGVKSLGYSFVGVTTINCASSEWHVTNTSIEAEIHGQFSTANATNGSQVVDGLVENGKVLFTGLYPGSSYNVSLFYSENLKQCGHILTLVPPMVTGLRCGYASGGYSFSLSWAAPQGMWTQVEIQVSDRGLHNATGMSTVIDGVQPAQKYHVTVTSVSGTRRSKPAEITCLTDPSGVIAGSVMAVLLLAVVAFLVVFILRRKPEILSPKLFVESKIASDNFKAIPTGKFEVHFNKMTCDQNRGFSEEYEDLRPVGSEQTCKAALIPQNTAKNRFKDVLPYDWSRVQLSIINGDLSSDYINANYMPGYGNNARQYIAAQGPLPPTVNDFWRMIWEQRVQGVVMLTNCIEGGKVKCEQYWPLDDTPCTYGDVSVKIYSEQKESSWTLREFEVKKKLMSEVRLVKHFHFTAWPDHGVPDGTSALIQFRGLVRHHIESCGSVGPTVVHCSAGVGRTGTLIALDVTLQQLQKDKAVGLAAYVHKMRLHRPLMVQTESQYVFLHQCIMDSLSEPEKRQEQPLYENIDMIYVNATALREFHSANGKA